MNSLRRHYPEYAIEAVGLGILMLAAVFFVTLMEHPASPISQTLTEPLLRRLAIGIGMAAIAISLIYSPWGKQSGAHFNPSVTFTFWRLGKVKTPDLWGYIAAQFIGGCAGMAIARQLLSKTIADPTVNYVITVPGTAGEIAAFCAEVGISFLLMMTVLIVSNTPKLAKFTGLFAGFLIANYITIEAPLSGMSMNPARTFASAITAQNWTAIWIYFTAPLLGMLSAAEIYIRVNGRNAVKCAKLHHQNQRRCIFRCGYRAESMQERAALLSDRFE